ncbi:hypothetical protein PFICI_13224 [Pestalotiopsis fici W106-1]|uniref:Uncharacterized protein n=1 Tax=Pestalotiopsis fici (strain W106-1 / CGMCC3.15140) TaxID=1229662 RepID=W3WLH5_PESFW|nr:uncharacterized protein PFICI_13224 [Pestalotiopsis fici W106-1]ETS74740.1 hypothetical protein PFICI_13224 [Pestalotiopsis fici W106-1]
MVFRPNCSLPESAPSGFVLSPNVRSTTGIAWSCVSIIILSTWSVLFLSVPPDINTTGFRQEIRRQLYLAGRKLAGMCIMLAFPELITANCIANLHVAWINCAQLRQWAEQDNVPWSMAHTLLANIGGIAVQFSNIDCEQGVPKQCSLQSHEVPAIALNTTASNDNKGPGRVEIKSNAEPDTRFASKLESAGSQKCDQEILNSTLSVKDIPSFLKDFQRKQQRRLEGHGETPWRPYTPHQILATKVASEMKLSHGNTRVYNSQNIAPLQGNIWILDANQLCLARRLNIIRQLPRITPNEIDDRSKSDGLMRFLAVMQLSWLAVELIARATGGMPSAALEISTLAFASMASIIYVIEWRKPKDIRVPFYVDADSNISQTAFAQVAQVAPMLYPTPNRHYYMPTYVIHQVIDNKYSKRYLDRIYMLFSAICTSIFGGIHLFAWNFPFPSHIETVLWRTSALIVVVVPIFSVLSIAIESILSNHTSQKTWKWPAMALTPIYLASRIYIMVESLRSLYYLPPEALAATWAQEAPHLW